LGHLLKVAGAAAVVINGHIMTCGTSSAPQC
jgi:hypothetical protein